MSRQIIAQPNGKFAIFLSFTDTLAAWDLSRGEVEEYFEEIARLAAEELFNNSCVRTRTILDDLTADPSRPAYPRIPAYCTWEEAMRRDAEHEGEFSRIDWPDPGRSRRMREIGVPMAGDKT